MIFKIVLIIFCFLLIALAIYFVVAISWHKHYNNNVQMSISQIHDLGCNITVNGGKGKGKTTSSCGIAHAITCYMIDELDRRMDEIRIKLNFIDFNFVHASFLASLEELSFIDNPPYKSWYYDAAIESSVLNVIYRDKEHKMDYWYSDFISLESCKNLLEDYLLYWLIRNLRHHYVVSSDSFYNRVSLEHALQFDPQSIELRNCLEKKNFDQDYCNIIFNDEASLSRGNVFSNDREFKTDGTVYFKILERNAFLGTHYTITMKQIATNEIKQYRDLADCNLDIFDRDDDLGTFKFLQRFLDFIFRLFCIPIKIWYFIISLPLINKIKFLHVDGRSSSEMFIDKMNSVCCLRKIEKAFFQLKKLLRSLGFIKVRFKLYKRAEDVGKDNDKKYDCYVFYFPVYWCYGVVDTYYYRPVVEDYMHNNSEAAKIITARQFDPDSRVDKFIDNLLEQKERNGNLNYDDSEKQLF